MSLVMGIDCGIAITGWSVIKKGRDDRLSVVDYGVIQTEARQEMGERLTILYDESKKLVEKYNPTQAAIESLFYFKNQKTVINVGQARGVSMLVFAQSKIPTFHYTPLQVKQAVTGYGKAPKDQIQRMVKSILKLDHIPKPDDAADALAVSICHLHTKQY